MIDLTGLTSFIVRAMYGQGRFLGGWTFPYDDLTYVDASVGDIGRFRGLEHIAGPTGDRLYELRYHGGLIRD